MNGSMLIRRAERHTRSLRRTFLTARHFARMSSGKERSTKIALGQPGDLDDDVQVGRTLAGVNAFQRRDVRVVTSHPDADVLLVDVGVVRGVVVPPAAGPGLHPRMALPVDGVTDLRLALEMYVGRHVAGRNTHATHQDQRQMSEVLANALPFAVRIQSR